ncbi:MAG: hypothetical protein QNJ00_05600 [Woeseiaceae bacterium]|nr:hypothetical protein [Woeseiaceae bacterium]
MQHTIWTLTALSALLVGCGTTASLSNDMAGWQGDHVSIALEAWGQPEAEQAFGAETVLIWRDRSTEPPAYLAEPGVPQVVCERMLAVDETGTITGWRWRGDACESLGASRKDYLAAR